MFFCKLGGRWPCPCKPSVFKKPSVERWARHHFGCFNRGIQNIKHSNHKPKKQSPHAPQAKDSMIHIKPRIFWRVCQRASAHFLWRDANPSELWMDIKSLQGAAEKNMKRNFHNFHVWVLLWWWVAFLCYALACVCMSQLLAPAESPNPHSLRTWEILPSLRGEPTQHHYGKAFLAKYSAGRSMWNVDIVDLMFCLDPLIISKLYSQNAKLF